MEVQLTHYSKVLKRQRVLDDITLTLAPGHIYGLYGRNGSGKSMLMRAIAGLITPSEGEVLVGGKRIGDEIDFPESMGLIIEHIQLQKAFSAKVNLEILAKIKHVATTKDIDWALTAVGLDPDDTTKVRNFSLGMNQKLAIAQAIFERPELLLLDEPTNALDFQTVANFHALIKSLATPTRIIMIATHNREDLVAVATDYLEMDAGKIYERNQAELDAVTAYD